MQTTPSHRMGLIEWSLLLSLSLIWGGSFLFGRMAVAEMPPITVAWVRVMIAAVVLAAIVAITRLAFPKGLSGWAPYFVMGAVNNVIPFTLIFWGQKEIGAGLAAVLNATTPLFAGILAHFFTTDEKLTVTKLTGVLIGVAGVAVLVGPTALAGLGAGAWPQLAVLGAAVSYGVAGLWGRRFRGTPPLVSACSQLACSTLILAPLALFVDGAHALSWPSLKVQFVILALAIICTSLAYVIFFTIVKRAGGTNVMLVTLLIPPSAILLGAIVLGESLSVGEIVGAAVIGLALLVIDGRVLDFLRTARPRI